jgi:hypothetical protein
MTFEEVLGVTAEQGAIRIWRVSGVWQIAYRWRDGGIQARSLNKVGEAWVLQDKLVGGDTYNQADGWYPVEAMHHRAAPIELDAAKSNPGYYHGLTRQCHTCKKFRPLKAFERDMEAEGGFRTWECNQCAAERRAELARYHQHEDEHVGDYVRPPAHTSRPPVEGEI